MRLPLLRFEAEIRVVRGRVVHFHSFRKTMQSLGVRYGINQRAAQEMLGHSDASRGDRRGSTNARNMHNFVQSCATL